MEELAERLVIGLFTGLILGIPASLKIYKTKKKKEGIGKQAKAKGLSVIEYLKQSNIPDNVFMFCEADRGNEGALRERLERYVYEKHITTAQAEALLEEYMKAK